MRVAGILLGGALYALALPPVDRSLFAWVALTPLVLALPGASIGAAFRYGTLFGYAMGWCVLWTLADAGTHYFGLGWPLSVSAAGLWFLVVVGVPFGLFAAGARLLDEKFGDSLLGPPVVAAVWVASEMLRGRLLAQPWALLGYTQHANLPLIQIAAVTGVYGVSYLLALVGVSVAMSLARLRAGRSVRGIVEPLFAPAFLVAICWVGGRGVIAHPPDGNGPSRDVAVVQTNVVPARTWTPAYLGAQLGAHLRATDAVVPSDAALIVWPEYAVPRYLEQDPAVSSMLGRTARREHADLLVGAPRYDAGLAYNSAQLIGSDGRLHDHYDKRRLVLFAETSPLRSLVPGAEHATERSEEFATGIGSGVVKSFVPLGVSICHEIIHPDLINDSVWHGAELLVNVANDAWISVTSPGAAEQHLAMATFRAVETHRYLVRGSLTGVSAIVDPVGRILGSVPAGQAGVVTKPVKGIDTLTWYVALGDAFGWTCVSATLATVLFLATRPRRPVVVFATSA